MADQTQQNPSFFNSPGFAAIINGAGGAATAAGAAAQNNANKQFQGYNNQIAANQGFEQQDTQKALAAAGMNPLGQAQRYAQHNALLSAILPNLQNSSLGGRSGGNAFLPSGGLDPQMIQNLYGQGATAEALGQYAKETAAVDPNAPQANLQNYGFAPSIANPVAQSVSQYAQGKQGTVAGYRSSINDAVQKQIDAENHSGGFLSSLGKYLGIAGAGALGVFGGNALMKAITGPKDDNG